YQKSDRENFSGYTFYNIRTKKSNIVSVVNYWRTDGTGDQRMIYGLIFTHNLDNVSDDFDKVTGLFGKRRFTRYIAYENNKDHCGVRYALAYINVVNFKLLNIEKGTGEGDRCLKKLADTLAHYFNSGYLSRLSDDHFAVLDLYENVMNNTSQVYNAFNEEYGKLYNVFLKIGILEFEYNSEFDPEKAISRAKIACDFIRRDNTSNIVEYSSEIEDNIKLREYVIRKLDEAIEKDWIQIYFQPVIRTITGYLCGLESLVRWIDPEIGFLAPDRFINVLEDERCIHKLDCFVVRRVCKYIRDRVDAGIPIVPVSVNFSQMDFVMCDMLEVVERAVEEFDIPRDYIHIEITESMIASDEGRMHDIISGFKKAGYEVWMDDFGSGYSSLTVLKDYNFDTLKMDMRFLRPFNEKSMSILRSVITMAKEIGLKTLAEGVETQEQLDFLKECGCGMIQGYYYGKPEPIEDMFRHIDEKGINVGKRKWRHFYETAGFAARYTESPLEVIEDDGKDFHTLFMNNSYRKQIFDYEMSNEEIDRKIYHTASPLLDKYRSFADQIEKSGKEETFYYTSNGMYLKFTGQAIAECEGHHIIRASIVNISMDDKRQDMERLDAKAKQLNLLFESVLLVKLKENTVTPIFGGFRYLNSRSIKNNDLQMGIKAMENDVVYPTERSRCHAFLYSPDLKERVEKTGRGYITGIFRTKQADGNYKWKEFFIMMIPGTGGNEYLFCIKNHLPRPETNDDSAEMALAASLIGNDPGTVNLKEGALSDPSSMPDVSAGEEGKKGFISGKDNNSAQSAIYGNELDVKSIWQNLMWNTNLKVFWKDRESRFIGVSKAFLDYFGFDSDDMLIGKTDDELGLHVDNESFNRIEADVLSKGEKHFNNLGHVIVNGEVREISFDVIPLYLNEFIAGIIGVFRDNENEISMIEARSLELKKDPVTGLMNAHAFVDGLIDFAFNYNEDGSDYGVIVVNNLKYDRIIQTYNKEFGDKVLNRIGITILEATGKNCIASRPKDSIFAVLIHVDDKERFMKTVEAIEENLKRINEVDGNKITMKIKIASKIRSESTIADERLYEKTLREVLK
ncbi:MAG: EAL domain-containing protein, partial [Lachnospiraceae bacterium]|nr:EAL domain-containing protein [Lachnospiraceae bacterium]